MVRVVAFVDGFNLYHALQDLRRNDLKWLDLWRLCEIFSPKPQYKLEAVYYFSAYATWRRGSFARHREYVKALTASGILPVLGKFKEKDRRCFSCQATWKDHEEKETDVNLAVYLLNEAAKDRYDRALLMSGDSDLAPAVRLVKREFPTKDVVIITPVGRRHSMDLVNAAGGLEYATRMKPIHVERSLFPKLIYDSRGFLVARRPAAYSP